MSVSFSLDTKLRRLSGWDVVVNFKLMFHFSFLLARVAFKLLIFSGFSLAYMLGFSIVFVGFMWSIYI